MIPNEMKERIYCMHINNDNCIEQAKAIGFNVVEVEHKKGNVLKK